MGSGRAEHIALADRLGELSSDQWDAPSRCDGWRVRHVLGHLVYLVEGYPSSEADHGGDDAATRDQAATAAPGRERQAARARLGARLASGMHEGFYLRAKELGEAPTPELLQRLREAAASRYNGLPTVAMSEVLIHGDDMVQPLGLRAPVRPEPARAALALMRWVNRLTPGFAFQSRRLRGVRLVAEDVDWSSGRGPEVRGSALDILGLLAGRAIAPDVLTGPGLAKLALENGD